MFVVPPGSGIVHQVNLDYLGTVVFNTDGMLYPNSVVGTDSHTTMIDGLGVAGWGVGIKAEAAMLKHYSTLSMVMTKLDNAIFSVTLCGSEFILKSPVFTCTSIAKEYAEQY